MAEIIAVVVAALKFTATWTCADMLGLDIFVKDSSGRTEWFELPFGSLPFCCLSFSSATSLTALMPTTVQGGFTQPRALRGVLRSLVTDNIE